LFRSPRARYFATPLARLGLALLVAGFGTPLARLGLALLVPPFATPHARLGLALLVALRARALTRSSALRSRAARVVIPTSKFTTGFFCGNL